jgi:hypothetical protein
VLWPGCAFRQRSCLSNGETKDPCDSLGQQIAVIVRQIAGLVKPYEKQLGLLDTIFVNIGFEDFEWVFLSI